VSLRIREARVEDARTVAEIHVRAWQHAYRGQLPEEYLDGLSVEEREQMWRDGVSQAGSEWRCWLAEREGRALGFCATGLSQDADADRRTAELFAIYLEPEVVSTGVGRELFAHAVDDLRARGFRVATLWVLETNEQAKRFYELAGWKLDGATTTERIDCLNYPTVRYAVDLV
jgi:ribosomal protein S18 acetylase RimI-like enzyme